MGRQHALLTDGQREFLRGEKDGNEASYRQDIRERLEHAIRDFEILLRGYANGKLRQKDLDLIFQTDGLTERERAVNAASKDTTIMGMDSNLNARKLAQWVALMYLGNPNFMDDVEKGIEKGEALKGRMTEVKIQLQKTETATVQGLCEKFDRGERLTMREAAMLEMLGEITIEEAGEAIQRKEG